ncbi:hypothetical protein GCM10028771_02810 [Nocardioides marmoraquaticus]
MHFGLVGAAVVGAAVAAGVMATSADPTLERREPEQPAAATPGNPVMAEALRLVEYYGCWTGDAPADMRGEVPGHVVVIDAGEAVYGGDRLVGLALRQVFDGEDHGLVVAGFCR